MVGVWRVPPWWCAVLLVLAEYACSSHHHRDTSDQGTSNPLHGCPDPFEISTRHTKGIDEIVVQCKKHSPPVAHPLRRDISVILQETPAEATVATAFLANSTAWVHPGEVPQGAKSGVESLSIRGPTKTRVSFDFQEDIRSFKGLRALHLYDVTVTDLSDDTVSFKSLQTLTCISCDITYFELPSSNVLTSITLNGNPELELSEDGWADSSITTISLRNSNLTTFPTFLLKTPALKHLCAASPYFELITDTLHVFDRDLRGNIFAPVQVKSKDAKRIQHLASANGLQLDSQPATPSNQPTPCKCGEGTFPLVVHNALCLCVKGPHPTSLAPVQTTPLSSKTPQPSNTTPLPSRKHTPEPTGATTPRPSTEKEAQETESPLQNPDPVAAISSPASTLSSLLSNKVAPSARSTDPSSDSPNLVVLISSIAGGVVVVALFVGVFVHRRKAKPGGLGNDLAVHLNSNLQPPGSSRRGTALIPIVPMHRPQSNSTDRALDSTDVGRRSSVVNFSFRVEPSDFDYPPQRLAGSKVYWVTKLRDKKVVVRRSHDIADAATLQGFVDAIKFVAHRPHPSLVAFKGVYFHETDGEFCAIVEFMDKRGLGSVLHARNITLDNAQKHVLAKNVVDAVAFVNASFESSFNPFCCVNLVVHTKSFLVNAMLECKLNVFQFTKSACRGSDAPTALGAGAIKWLPPELMANRDVVECCTLQEREAGNVYRLGLVLGEIFTRTLCFAPLLHAKGHVGGDMYLISTAGFMGDSDPLLDPFDWAAATDTTNARSIAMIRSCCARDPSKRPPLQVVVGHFTNVNSDEVVQASRLFQTMMENTVDPSGSEGEPGEQEDEGDSDNDDEVDEGAFASFHTTPSTNASREHLVESFRSSMRFLPSDARLPPPSAGRSVHEATL